MGLGTTRIRNKEIYVEKPKYEVQVRVKFKVLSMGPSSQVWVNYQQKQNMQVPLFDDKYSLLNICKYVHFRSRFSYSHFLKKMKEITF